MLTFARFAAVTLPLFLLGESPSHGVIVKSESEGVALEVTCPPSFELSSICEINYTLELRVNRTLKTIKAGETIGDELRLISPSGDVLTPYPYDKRTNKLFYVETLQQGVKLHFSFRVFPFYYMPMAGEYRCVLTRILYEPEDPPRKPKDRMDQGKVIRISSPEFRFRIEKIDPDYKAPWMLGHPDWVAPTTPALSEPQSDLPPSESSRLMANAPPAATAKRRIEPLAQRWTILAVLVFGVVGYLWRRLSKRG